MPAWLDGVKTRLGMIEEEPAEQTLLQQLDSATTLDRTQRAIGFATCAGIGLMLSFLAPMFILRPTKFAMVYTLSALCSMSSTAFLMGPATQLKRMFDGKRWLSTTVWLLTIVLTLVAALALHSALLCLLCIAVQFVAFAWYCLSYIPYGQQMARRFLGLGGGDEGDGQG